jgi:hypothetical protein
MQRAADRHSTLLIAFQAAVLRKCATSVQISNPIKLTKNKKMAILRMPLSFANINITRWKVNLAKNNHSSILGFGSEWVGWQRNIY